MIKLDATTKTIEVDLDAAVTTNQLPIYATYSDVNTSTFELSGTGSEDTATNDTTAVTAVSAPGSSTTRKVDLITVYNADTVAATVTVQLNNNTTLRTLVKETLQPGETLQYADGEGWSVPNKKKGIESTLNTTTSTLSGAGTYTGTAEQNDYPDVMCSCYADVAGTLYFDFSINGTDWRTFPTSGFVVSAGIHEFHTAVKGPRYFRVRYVNGSSAQSTFQLTTYYGVFKQPNAPLNQPYGLDADSILTRPSLPWLDISRGLVSGVSVVEKFGYNASVGTSFEPVCSAQVYPTPTSAVSLEFVSSDTADALDDTGAHEVTIEGLDANWEPQTVATAAHATDGLTAVSISGTWLRVFRAYVSKSGTYGTSSSASHVGTITVRVSGGGATYANIPVINSFPIGQSLIGAYTIPAGYTGYVFLTSLETDSTKTTKVGFFFRDNADDTSSSYNGVIRVQSLLAGLTGGVPLNRTGSQVPFGPYTGPCDVGFLAAVNSTTAEVSVEFEIILVNE